MGKIDVNGDKADPVYQYLKNEKAGILGLTRIKYVTANAVLTVDGTSYELS